MPSFIECRLIQLRKACEATDGSEAAEREMLFGCGRRNEGVRKESAFVIV